MLEVKKEMVCATQMVGSGKGDSTFPLSCVKAQMGCSLWCSKGRSEGVWTVCAVVGWEGCKHFSAEGRVFGFLQLCSQQAARKDADVVPHFVQENELGDLSKACSGMRWFSTPTLTLPPHSCIYGCQMRDLAYWDGQWFPALPTSFSSKSSSGAWDDTISHRSDGHERGERPFWQIIALITDNKAPH